MSDKEFLEAFESHAWPVGNWHHREHIKVAYLYLLRHPLEEATAKMRTAVKSYNEVKQIPDSPTRGYHETMTIAWMHLACLTLCEYGPAENADSFFEQHPQLSHNKNLGLFYSRDRFMSPQAKIGFVEPDLAPLPKSKKAKP